jgi:hypothetical protein
MVLASSIVESSPERDPQLLLALALEALERSCVSGRPVLGRELPAEAERARLTALCTYDLYHPGLNDALQGITRVASAACGAFAALVTLIDSDLQWVRAASGETAVAYLDERGRSIWLGNRTIRTWSDSAEVMTVDRCDSTTPSRSATAITAASVPAAEWEAAVLAHQLCPACDVCRYQVPKAKACLGPSRSNEISL